MKKANYRMFCLIQKEWDKNNVVYSIKDLIILAKQHNCPIPIKIKIDYNIDNTLERLADLWRYAENYYLETCSSWQKDRLYKFQKMLNLSEKQTKELEDICYSMGI